MKTTQSSAAGSSNVMPDGLPQGATRSQIMVALAMMSLCPRIRGGEHSFLTIRAGRTFDRLLGLAVKAGFPKKEKRLFIGGLHGGKPIQSVMARAERRIELSGPAAFHAEMERHAALEHHAATGRLLTRWSWQELQTTGGTT